MKVVVGRVIIIGRIRMDEAYLFMQAEIEKVICKREAMIAENKQRECLGQSLAYGEKSFIDLKNEIDFILNKYR